MTPEEQEKEMDLQTTHAVADVFEAVTESLLPAENVLRRKLRHFYERGRAYERERCRMLRDLLTEAVCDYDEHGPNVVSVEWLDRVRTAIRKGESA